MNKTAIISQPQPKSSYGLI